MAVAYVSNSHKMTTIPTYFTNGSVCHGIELIDKYEHSPIVTADNRLTLLKKETGIG